MVFNETSSEKGSVKINIPIKPRITDDHLKKPTFSFNKNGDSRVTKITELWNKAVAWPKGKFRIANIHKTIPENPKTVLNAIVLFCEILKADQPRVYTANNKRRGTEKTNL